MSSTKKGETLYDTLKCIEIAIKNPPKQGKLEIADEMARGGLSGVDQYILNRYK